MTKSEQPRFSSVPHFIQAVSDAVVARQVHRATGFEINGNSYRLTYTDVGPQIARADKPGLLDVLTHRFAERSLSSHAERMTRGIAGSAQARGNFLDCALEDWCKQGPTERRAEAVARMLACHASGVAELDLRGLGLSSLPPALALLPHVGVLRLGANRLTCVPPAIRGLSRLRVLELDHNQLCDLPKWMAGLCGLQVLSVKANRLTAYPDWLDELPCLALLWLGQNQIRQLPVDIGLNPQRRETFASGNPVDGEARAWIAMSCLTRPDAPFHHEHADTRGSPYRNAGVVVQSGDPQGRLVAFIHDTPPDAPAFPVEPASALTSDEAAACTRLFDEIRAKLARDMPAMRSGPIMQYRLQLLERWVASDAQMHACCSAMLRLGLEDCAQGLVSTLDDVELHVIQCLLEREGGGPRRIAALGRGLLRLSLLTEVLGTPTRNRGLYFDMVYAHRMLLGGELRLPGETRALTQAQLDQSGVAEDTAHAIRDEVLRLEKERDFARLDAYMANWKPWQAFVCRTARDAVGELEGVRQRAVAAAEALRDSGALALPVYEQTAADIRSQYDMAFRQLCRDTFRRYRAAAQGETPPPC